MHTPGGGPQTATGEVSYHLGDTVDRIVYVLEGVGETASAPTLQLAVSCRFFGDRQFIVRVDGESFTRHCGTTIEIPLQARIEAGLTTGLITISAPGLGPTRVEWTITARLHAPG